MAMAKIKVKKAVRKVVRAPRASIDVMIKREKAKLKRLNDLKRLRDARGKVRELRSEMYDG